MDGPHKVRLQWRNMCVCETEPPPSQVRDFLEVGVVACEGRLEFLHPAN